MSVPVRPSRMQLTITLKFKDKISRDHLVKHQIEPRIRATFGPVFRYNQKILRYIQKAGKF